MGVKNFFLLVIFLPLIAFSSESEILKLSNELKIYDKTEWKALLHYDQALNKNVRSFINSENFSLENELRITINGFYQPKEKYTDIDQHPQCKFPARLLFIINELNILKNEFPEVDCEELKEYEIKAPADNMFLIYTSENVKIPSSMMGHTFLKYSGKNDKNDNVEHAITFYTVIESYNLLWLMYQNIYSGMKGFFALQPYQNTLSQYIDKENRNVWEYELKLSDYRKKLMYYHVWELKDKDMKYYFSSYNCSTVLYYILSLANPAIYDDKKLWVTPLDTIKFLYRHDLIEHSKLIASNEWLVKMLKENVDSKDIDTIKTVVQSAKYGDIDTLDYYSYRLLEAYATLKYKNGELNIESYKNIQSKIPHDDKGIDISKYKSPNNIPPERQFGVGYAKVDDENFAKLSFLPASHLINDYNREYFGESELKIGHLSLLANSKKIELDEFTLYGMKLYIPYDTLTNDFSYQFEMAIKKEPSEDMIYTNILKIDGGFGFDFEIAKDINMFVLLNGGVKYDKYDKANIFLNPQVGGMIYEIFNMKSFVCYEPVFVRNDKIYDKYILKHNVFLDKNSKLYFNIEKIDGKKDIVDFEMGLNILF